MSWANFPTHCNLCLLTSHFQSYVACNSATRYPSRMISIRSSREDLWIQSNSVIKPDNEPRKDRIRRRVLRVALEPSYPCKILISWFRRHHTTLPTCDAGEILSPRLNSFINLTFTPIVHHRLKTLTLFDAQIRVERLLGSLTLPCLQELHTTNENFPRTRLPALCTGHLVKGHIIW